MKQYLRSATHFLARFTLLYILALLNSVTGVSQNIEATLTSQFEAYRNNALQEKLYLHSDKDIYVAGEICWFKIYIVDGFSHKPLDISKIGYVELLDASNKPVLQAKVKLQNSTGSGSLFVPVSINSGNYTLRAYSNWMKNFDAGYFYEKRLTIINTQKAIETPAARNTTNNYDVQFFPEGGNLVNELNSKVAFSVKDQSGKGVKCNLVIVSDKKDTVATSIASKAGMGTFTLMPKAGNKYWGIITLPNGSSTTRELPAVYAKGVVMQLLPEGEKRLRVTVSTSADESMLPYSMLYLFVHNRGSVKAALGAAIQNGAASFIVDREKLGEGVSQFTILNAAKKPLCERLYFKYPAAKLAVDVSTGAAVYSTRQKVTVDISSLAAGKPIQADMSMAVYRVDSLQQPKTAGIDEYLLLSSDLRGNVEWPADYLNAGAGDREAAVDLLMLTNGWRRYRWEDILQNRSGSFRFVPEYNGHIVTGRVINNKTNQPAASIKSYLSIPGQNPKFFTATSNEQGMVKFELGYLAGTPGIIVQTDPEDGADYHVEIENPFSGQYANQGLPMFSMPLQNAETLAAYNIAVQVENIYNGEKRKRVREEIQDTTRFYYKSDEMYLLDLYTRFTTMEEVLREYILTVNVRRRGGKFHLPVYNDADRYNGMFEKDPLILLDGVPIFDIDKFMSYDPLKVRKLESVTRRYFYGNNSFDGIVSLFTYNGDLQGYDLDPRATVIDYEGLQLQREFYSPLYPTSLEVSGRIPDFRNVLSWRPELKTDKSGKFQAEFYSSDLPGKYMIEVQGLTADGLPGSRRVYFEVQKRPK